MWWGCPLWERYGSNIARLTADITIVLLLIWISNLHSTRQQTEYFILDPTFPERLNTSGYRRILNFIQSLFEEYAQAGLSKELDREIAISGLLERMKYAIASTLASRCRYGIFECLISRLLLWRVSGNVDDGTANAGTLDHHLPSWSWMTHNRIEFFPDGMIKILREGNFKFGSSGPELLTQIRRLQNCQIKQQGSQHLV